MEILSFDSDCLRALLERLSPRLRAVFALLCAERLFRSATDYYAKMASQEWDFISRLRSRAWESVEQDLIIFNTSQELDRFVALVPEESAVGNGWTQEATNAQNAGMAFAYALRTLQTGDVQEAIWSAQVTYEALDNWVINHQCCNISTTGVEAIVLAHPLIQAELRRQRNDLNDLLNLDPMDIPNTIFKLKVKAEQCIFYG